MYELRRALIESAGPNDARFDSVPLDFRSADGGPSPAAVMFLENGGGKSVMIQLLFSVLVPGRRKTVAADEKRTLESLVAGKDTSHIVLEWERVGQPGDLLLTGKVLEWQGLAASSDPGKLNEAWWTLKPDGGPVALDSLPTRADGRKIRMAAFLEALRDAGRAAPALEFTVVRVQREWQEHLDRLGLDPKPFEYQGRMNQTEGQSVSDMFKFSSSKEFVDYFLDTIISPEDPGKVAALISQHAERLAKRPVFLREREYTEGCARRLEPLAHAHARLQEASAGLAQARVHALSVSAALQAGADRAKEQSGQEHARSLQASEQASSHAGRVRELRRWAEELRRLAAEFDLGSARQAAEEADAARAAARSETEAWEAAGILARHGDAAARAGRLRDALASQEQDAAPLIAARDAAARRLAQALVAASRAAQAGAQDADGQAAQAEGQAAAADKRWRELAGQAAAARGKAEAAERALLDIQSRREALADDGLIAPAQPAAEALAALQARQQAARARQDAARARQDEIASERQAARDGHASASARAASALRDAQAARTEHGRLDSRARELAGRERLQEIAGEDSPSLDRAQALAEAVRQAAAASEQALVTFEMDAAADRRSLEALRRDGRLPASGDVEQALALLDSAGIAARSGWDFLSTSVAADARPAAVAALPALAAGVVLTGGADPARALQALAGLQPAAPLAIGTSRDLQDGLPRPGAVLAPSAALYDEAAAEAELAAVEARVAAVGREREQLQARCREDRDLARDLDEHASACPPGRLAELDAAAASAQAQADGAQREAADLERAQAALDGEARRLRDSHDSAGAELQSLARGEARLLAFAEASADEDRLGPRARAARAASSAAEAEAESCRLEAQQARQAAAEARRLADGLRRDASLHAGQLQSVLGAGGADEIEPHAGPVEQLAAAYEFAQDQAERKTSGSQLAAEHEAAARQEAQALRDLEAFPSPVRARAAQILQAAGSDGARREGAARARRQEDAAVAAASRASSACDIAAQRLAAETSQDTSRKSVPLPAGLQPSDARHARQLLASLEEKRTVASEQERDAKDASAHAGEQARLAGSQAKLLASHAGHLASTVGCEPSEAGVSAQPFSGSDEDAGEQARQASRGFAAAHAARDAAQEQQAEAGESVSKFAHADQYREITGRIRDRMTAAPAEIAPHAAQLAADLLRYAEDITRELAEIEDSRGRLIGQLSDVVAPALRSLKAAGRRSRLADGLGEWSGQQFLRIDFSEPESDDVRRDRLGAVIDRCERARSRAGMDLLKEAVSEIAGPSGFRVTVLKPSPHLRNERVAVTDMQKFSGGQKLTAGIALYCTMAAMRAHDRARPGARAGVLFLDNPIGTASAEYLLDIQFKVAARQGVQLLFTTGVHDLAVLDKFPVMLRLRNNRDLKSSAQFVTAAEPVRAALACGPDDGTGQLSAVRAAYDPDAVPA